MTRLPLMLIPLLLAACAAPGPEGATAQGEGVYCPRETAVGTMIPKSQCRSASQRAADRAAVDGTGPAVKNQAVQPADGK